MLKIDPIQKITVTDQIMEQIAELITTGKLKPGDKLPNERELSAQFEVNRGRIREALRALALIGLIRIKAGEGSFVTQQEVPIPPQTITWMYHNEINNLDEIYQARKLIESEVFLLAAKCADDKDKERLEQILGQLSKTMQQEDAIEEYQKLVDEFDFLMGEICGNQIYAKLLQTIVYLRRESNKKLLNVPGAQKNSIKRRTKLVQAIKEDDLDKVREAIDQLFISAKDFFNIIKPE